MCQTNPAGLRSKPVTICFSGMQLPWTLGTKGCCLASYRSMLTITSSWISTSGDLQEQIVVMFV